MTCNENTIKLHREVCYRCYRPNTSCMCKYIKPFNTYTKFIILMHDKEFKKTKNGTGHFTNNLLNNCELFVGVDFSNHDKINRILDDKNNCCFVLYPHKNSTNLNTTSIKNDTKTNIIFIIDSTWACSKTLLFFNKKIANLPKVSFTHNKESKFEIKEQPADYCLSTIESTHCVLELLNLQGVENISTVDLDNFLMPFTKMVEYQKNYVVQENKNIRYKKPFKE